jgi:integrase/recombinase XerD
MARRKGQHKQPVIMGDPTDPVGFPVLMARFADWMRVKNYAARTVGNRMEQMAGFSGWCVERAVARPAEVTKPILERYQRWLYHRRKDDGRPLTFRSQYTALSVVKTFFRWLTRQNYLLSNPASEIELPRLEKRLPRHVLNVSEAEAVLTAPALDTPLGVRDRAMLETFYSTGIRRMELAGLAVYDLDVERGTLMVRQGKGKKDRMIPIGPRAVAWIDKYLREVRSDLVVEPDDGTIFLTNEGEAFSGHSLTALVRGYVRASGIAKTGACHLFRHTMATLMLENGADIRFIQAMLGHVSLTTTEIYSHVAIRKLKEIHTATHPGARLGPAESHGSAEATDEAAALLDALAAEATEEDDAGEERDDDSEDAAADPSLPMPGNGRLRGSPREERP